MSNETFMITGSMGCIGAWVLRNLVAEGVSVVATDLATDPVRPRLLLNDDELSQIKFATLDVTNLNDVQAMVEKEGVTHIIHLAGLQVPFCKANPSLGAQVNVVGTVNIFEAARKFQDQVKGLAYASSLAVLGPSDLYPETPIKDDAMLHPETLYGVYKQANEHTARIYWQDWGIGSVGLRPYIVYGVARDQGMTADIAKAILAVAAEQPFHINFGGSVALQYADDVAKMFIGCARANYQGAAACNLRNDVIAIADFIQTLQTVSDGSGLTYNEEALLPFPADLDDSGLQAILGKVPHTPIETAIEESLSLFKNLVAKGQVDLAQLSA
ncbi:MAG: NAD(P)-dependent oxidoreductase [Chloroflexota bacterium]